MLDQVGQLADLFFEKRHQALRFSDVLQVVGVFEGLGQVAQVLIDSRDLRIHFAQAGGVTEGSIKDTVGTHGLGRHGQLPQNGQVARPKQRGIQGLPACHRNHQAEQQHLGKAQGEFDADAGIDQQADQLRKHGLSSNLKKRFSTQETLNRFGDPRG